MPETPRRILHKPGWSGRDLTKAALCLDLTDRHRAAIADLMAAIRAKGLDFGEVRRADFTHPALDGFLAGMLRQLRDGPGLVVLRGFPVEEYSVEEMQAIYWGIGTHFGTGVSQSAAGDLLGHVADRTDPASGKAGRGYQSRRELIMHTDSAEWVGLLCVRRSKSGGENVFASTLRLYEIAQAECPEIVPVLERGFPYHRRGEEGVGDAPISPYDVPIFSHKDGITSCRYGPELLRAALHDLNRVLSPVERAALDFMDTAPLRPDVRFDLQLEAGEAVFMNNYELLHSRTGFEDWPEPERRRLLFRLWLQGDPPRPLVPEIHAYRNKGGRQGIDHQPGREPGRIGYRVNH